MPDDEAAQTRSSQLTDALRCVVLMRETGPKRAAWHRARVQTIWRLHRLLAEAQASSEPPEPAPARQQ